MNIEHWGKQHRFLNRLLQQQQHWQRLQQCINQSLPANLSQHCSVACINADGQLVVYAHNHLVAGRLKMLLPSKLNTLKRIDSSIQSIHIKLRPNPAPKPKRVQRQFSNHALDSFDDAAEKTAHHPELAAALQRFANKRRS